MINNKIMRDLEPVVPGQICTSYPKTLGALKCMVKLSLLAKGKVGIFKMSM
jgi:hypothetical protein